MKKKIKKNRLKIFIALSLMITTIFGVMFATNTFAYTYDEETNTITSDNLLNIENVNETSINGITYSIINGVVTINGTANTSFNIGSRINDISIGTYSSIIYVSGSTTNNSYWVISPTSITHGNVFRLGSNNEELNTQYITTTGKYIRYLINTNTTYNNYKIKFMLISGADAPLNYEPQGTFINETLYNDLENDYDTLENDYNDLQDDYDTLENDYNDLQDDYDALQNQYDEINEQYSSVIDVASIGIWDYIYRLYWNSSGSGTYELSLQDLLDNNVISGNMIDFGVLVDLYPSPTDEYSFSLYFNSSFPLNVNLINIYVEMTDLRYYDILDDTNYPIDFYFQLGHIENNYVSNSVQPIVLWFNKTDILPFNNYVNRLYIESQGTYLDYYNAFTNITLGNYMKFSSTDYLKFYSYNTQYQIGYQQGLNESNNISKNYYESIIDTKNAEINSLNTNIEQLERANTILQQQVATSDSYNLNNLIWTIGSTPFESFKHIWNVNFFGVNIADFVLGLITFFIGLFIVKKFFL